MSIVYLLKNQHNQYLERSGEWAPPESSKSLFRTEFKDEAINRKVEFSVKNVSLRLAVVEAKQEVGGKLVIETEDLPPIALEQNDEMPTTSPADKLQHGEANALDDDEAFEDDEALDEDARDQDEQQLAEQEEHEQAPFSHALFEAPR